MSLRKIVSDTKNQDSGYAKDVFKDVNLKRSEKPKQKPKMIQRTIKIYPEEKDELQIIFKELGLEFNSGVRFALKEFKRNHAI